MDKKVINGKTEELLSNLSSNDILKNFYLAGGTSLALQYLHRKSIDLDWFSQEEVNTNNLKKKLSKIEKLNIKTEESDTLNLEINKIQLSFFHYPYKILFPFIDYKGIKLADERDIACMKLYAISSRGSKKDFIDLFFILKKYSLSEIIKLLDKKYENIRYNKLHILKSLTYFTEADNEPMPIMIKETNWKDIKLFFQDLAKKIEI